MGKSITGGFYPQSFVLGTREVMTNIGAFEMASTYAMAPLAITAAEATIEVIDRERLMDRAAELGTRGETIVANWDHPLVDYVASMGADSNLFLKRPSARRWLHYAYKRVYIPTRARNQRE
ncbi:Ornithine aminotransferase car2 [Cyphellophora attinorum]|uniref:Ornithine aminotransferase n=1 Tax=Cyphellophora attinorum TaxID=1664694 RepID=A0A0N0NJ68_9EURO|nr:Ornithine aminotransferase car2 [Phialophora attinorum]KPI36568.1 Ornithine aminotransferase car2 [Phialophora attinorum]